MAQLRCTKVRSGTLGLEEPPAVDSRVQTIRGSGHLTSSLTPFNVMFTRSLDMRTSRGQEIGDVAFNVRESAA